MSYATYPIPSHCEVAIVLEQGIMLVFAPIITPFRYKININNADDFWAEHCSTCALRTYVCKKTGALSAGYCALGNKIKKSTQVKTVQMPVPRHILFFTLYEESLKFAYEKSDGVLAPMKLSNIWSDGRWCDGDVDFNRINPTSIYTGYFSSIHNQDLTHTKPYGKYIEDLAAGRIDIEDEDFTFNPEKRWGSVRCVVENPRNIEWSSREEPEFLKIRGYDYAKIS